LNPASFKVRQRRARDILERPVESRDIGENILLRLRILTCILVAACGPLACSADQDGVSPGLPDDRAAIHTAPPLPEGFQTSAPENLESVRLLEQHVQALLERIRPATVALSGGSGVVVSQDGFILTCAHVNQRPGRLVTVTFPDGKRVKAVTLGNNHGVDAGMVKITDEGEYPFVPMGSSADAQPGQWCLAVGYPVSFSRGLQPAVRLGRVSVNKPRMIVSDCAIMGGDSGGPLFDLYGNVIGINSRVNNSLEMNIHVPVDVYRESWDRFIASQDWSDQTPRTYMGITRDEGFDRVRVSQVKPNSPAERAGIQVGDLISAFDSQPVATFDELLSHMSRHKPKDRVRLTILRGQETFDISIELEFWPTGQ
jgi:serine protease Do